MPLGCRNFRVITNSYMFGSDYPSEVTDNYLLCEDCGHVQRVGYNTTTQDAALAHATELYFATPREATKEELGRVK